MKLITAKYVVPVAGDPIENGAVAVENGEIVAVGPANVLAADLVNAQIVEHGTAAILPGFVNCHSHLEISSMRGKLDDVEHDFRSWLLKLNETRSGFSGEEIEAAALVGAREGLNAGVTCFGDIGRSGIAGMKALLQTGQRGVIFQETEFSPDERTGEEDLLKLRRKYDELACFANGRVEAGVSPHSPYTVSGRLFSLIAEWAGRETVKVSIHAAESDAENELLFNGRGFFTEIYPKFGFEWKSPGCSPIEFLSRTGILNVGPLLAHCVKAGDTDLDLIANSGSSVAHCPKSNNKFGHGWAPLEKMLEAGINVGLGSDSVASNNVCDMLEESRFAVLGARGRPGRVRHLSAREAVELATAGGAKALGLDSRIGTIEPGKCADLAVVSLGNIAQQPVNDIYAALAFSSNARDVEQTYIAGEPKL